MSIDAMVWVFAQDIRPSSIKFVLLALADNCGDDEGTVWPSISTIAEKTSQDRKTVIEAISTLEAMGFLMDTGARVGATRQVKVYKIVGLPSSRRHYTYLLTEPETGRFYFGVRSCSCRPEQDIEYMGSGKWPQATRGLAKKILREFETREEAEAHEIRLIRENEPNENCMNVLGKRFRNRNSSENGSKEYRFSAITVPETGHGTVSITTKEPGTEFPLTPTGEGGITSFKTKRDFSEGFDEFWRDYPKKVSKQAALRAWKKNRCADVIEEIILSLCIQREWHVWTKKDGQFIPHPASWLNDHGWKNEEHGHQTKHEEQKPKKGF